MRECIVLRPVLKETVWGGDRLATQFDCGRKQCAAGAEKIDFTSIGESWIVSAHPHGDCIIEEGTYAGETLSGLYKKHPELFGNLPYEEFPLLLKIIDAKSNLSIQVHPDDAYAREKEGCPFGKTECWYVMDCPEDAQLIIGHHAKTREELTRMVRENRYEELICRVPVKKGDFIQIEPGTIHAITGGMLLMETQQNSDITYRVYDYGRLVDGKPRQLHVEQSLEVIKVPDNAGRDGLIHTENGESAARINERKLLVDCTYYKVWKLTTGGTFTMEQSDPFLIATVLEGSGSIDGREMTCGDSLLFPTGYGDICFSGDMTLLLCTAN